MIFNTILPGAWELTQDIQRDFFKLYVPSAWQQVAKSLAQQRVKLQGKGYPSAPVYSLDPIIAASFPQIIQTMRNGWQRPGVPWLIATEPTDNLDELPTLIKDWLREEFSGCLEEEDVEFSLSRLDDNLWHWEDEPTSYSLLNQPENRYDDIRFQALPDYLAGEFLKNPVVCFPGEVEYQLTFYRAVSVKPGAELMSWPPYRVPLFNKYKEQIGTADISFVIHFKLQTVPWRNHPIIYHQLSIRRWITAPLERLPYRGATAYIGDNRRWLDGVRQPFCFMALPLKRAGGEGGWPKPISELLRLNDSPLPNPDTLASNPTYNWSVLDEQSRGIQAAIAYDTRHNGEQPCLPGVSPRDLASLDQAIQHRINDGFPVRRVGEAVRVSGTLSPFWEPGKPQKRGSKKQKDPNDLSTPMLRPKVAAPAVFRQCSNPLHTILILWETPQCRDALITEICQLLSLSPQGETKFYNTPTGGQGEETVYEGELGSLCIKTQFVEDLTQRLDIDNPSVLGNSRQKRRVNLLDKRVRQITAFLPPTEGLNGALVEIKPKQKYFSPESDPKLAWRIGAMQAGYANQHIHALTGGTKKKSDQERVKRAVSDLLRQFGILPAPLIKPDIDGIEPSVWLVCFLVIRRTRKTTASNTASTVVLMLRVNPMEGKVEVTTPSLFQEKEPLKENPWVSYPVGLSHLIREKWEPNSDWRQTTSDTNEQQPMSEKKRQQKAEQQAINQFVIDCLRDCLNTPLEKELSPRVLFMAEAQNARQLLTWLKNPDLPANDLPGEFKRQMTQSEIDRLWVVRLRVAENGEVPVGIVKGSPGSRTGGLFYWQDVCDDEANELYLSVRKLFNTEQGTSTLKKEQSRLDDGKKQAGNPRLLEIAVVHHPEIDGEKLASFVHNLRDRWPYFADEVSLPFPFPFATLAKEYAVSARDTLESEASEEV
ncbi:pPIWI_RE module domain-containing protein [Coleofasciculus sp.]|uniref:pPIWI_RE module domain-containing protein n=1 Tax=Coleofasciculus sp. TaxID=3100458 RepID=UPI003A4927B9